MSASSVLSRASILNVTTAKGKLAKEIHVRYQSAFLLGEAAVESFTTFNELLRFLLSDSTFMSDADKVHFLGWIEASVNKALKAPVGAGYFSMSMPIRGNWNNGFRKWEISNDSFAILCDYDFGRCNEKADWVRYDFDGAAYACEHHMSGTYGFEWEPID